MHSKYTRQNLVDQAVGWLVNWNYKVFRQEVNEPHPDDISSKGIINLNEKMTTILYIGDRE